ncbi:MAG TPA: HD domain-containing protein, partial [Candidatus Limnocylindria bacterium]|nr:HD domain-containing protein [Candidatus Limnocylindria bacterium]
MTRTDELLVRTIEYFAGAPRQAQHLLKVRGFALLIGGAEGLDGAALRVLDAAAVVHDVGIPPALEKYGSAAGPYQEELGPEQARALMAGWPEDEVERVCWRVAHHHPDRDVTDPDHRALVEADWLVNLYEHGAAPEFARG